MKEKVVEIKQMFNEEIKSIDNIKDLNELRVKYLGKKGEIQKLSPLIKDLSNDEKKDFGKSLNETKKEVSKKIEDLLEKLESKELEKRLLDEKIDTSLPSTKLPLGFVHPLTKVRREIEEIFVSMGYDVVEGPEVEFDLYNFEKLNLPKNHPARDAQDTFYVNDEVLLRTQTSPVQVRTMEKSEGEIRIISPGKTYRRDDDDPTHSHQFMQIEGLVIGKNISLAHLKGTLEEFAKKIFGKDVKVRFRPSYFPFTEPSIEVDISCFKCKGKGCSFCSNTGFIEILGSGMVHPNVLRMSGYDPEVYKGFAFGLGIERVAMLKYGISDIRDFYTNDLRFLNQFNRKGGLEDEA